MIAKTWTTTKWVELIYKREFGKSVLDWSPETFVLHITALQAPKPAEIIINPSWAISIAALK